MNKYQEFNKCIESDVSMIFNCKLKTPSTHIVQVNYYDTEEFQYNVTEKNFMYYMELLRTPLKINFT